MSVYDFRQLSSQDFEELTRDLLQKEWQVSLESFKTGKDSGIDLRHSTVGGESIIVQCKHYVVSGYQSLHRHLKSDQVPQVKALAPDRYVLVTSLGLSPRDKRELIELFAPWVRSTSDILGQNDLNNLLGKFPDVEKRHFKLWLTSTAVLDRVLKNAVATQTNFKIEKITNKLPVFVETMSLPAAHDIVDRNHYVIISGIPGIGKTTLAEMLLYVHLERGFAPVQVTENIRDAFDLYDRGQNQIFYYDDFLGRTILNDRLGKNEDAALVEFMELARSHENVRFVMTTREYILRNALMRYEKLATSITAAAKYVLNLFDYSKSDKARILYNHLYFSSLDQDYINELLRDKYYFQIINHPNFSPRIVEWMANLNYVQDVAVENYQQHFGHTLNFPSALWKHAFDNQIEWYSRVLLLALYTLSTKSSIDVLRIAFNSFQEIYAERYNTQGSPRDFQFGLKELEGTFTITTRQEVEFHNPAVKDFLEEALSEEPAWAEYLLQSAVFFQQVETLWLLHARDTENSSGRHELCLNADSLHRTLTTTLESKVVEITSVGGTRVYRQRDTRLFRRAVLLIHIHDSIREGRFLDLLTHAVRLVAEKVESREDDFAISFDYEGLHELILALLTSSSISDADRAGLLAQLESSFRYGAVNTRLAEELMVLDSILVSAEDWWPKETRAHMRDRVEHYVDYDFMDEQHGLDESIQLRILAGNLEELGNKYFINTRMEIDIAEEKADEVSAYEEARADHQLDLWKEDRYLMQDETEGIENMFDTLA